MVTPVTLVILCYNTLCPLTSYILVAYYLSHMAGVARWLLCQVNIVSSVVDLPLNHGLLCEQAERRGVSTDLALGAPALWFLSATR